MNAPITRIVKLHFKEGNTEAFKAIFQEMKKNIVAFDGCFDVTLLQHTSNPNIFFTYSHWESEEALNAYRHSELFQSTWKRVKQYFAEKAQAWSTIEIEKFKENQCENSLELSDYSVDFGDSAEILDKFLSGEKYDSIFVLVDENTRLHCLQKIKTLKSLSNSIIIEIKSGEENKNIETCQFIWKKLIDANAGRNSLLINLGGGVIGDMGGFCASCYKRGIDFIQIPTTLLSQVDASVGGKLGIDFAGLKNIVGQFCNPQKVIIDSEYLLTLPFEQIRSGYAEMLKHALIWDKDHWGKLIQENIEDVTSNKWLRLIKHSVNIKKEVVQQDPFEKNIRKALNLGHTIGHAVESYFLNYDNAILHGEAVAYGILAENFLAKEKGLLSEISFNSIKNHISKIYPKIEISKEAISEIIDYTKNDKKNEGSEINVSLLADIGTVEINHKISVADIEEAILFLNDHS